MTQNVLARGMRLLTGEDAAVRRRVLDACRDAVERWGHATEVVLPTIEPRWIYEDRAGEEVLGQMYLLEDRKGRPLCLRPEGTATCQLTLPPGNYWYEARCFRYERPQAGRYREFTQFGFEIIGDTHMSMSGLILRAGLMIRAAGYSGDLIVNKNVSRGLAYYTGGKGFEILIPSLGAQKQVVGGGPYEGGCGFAIGVDRLALAIGIGGAQ